MDVFVAATYARLGRQFEATAVVERLARSGPDYPAAAWIANYQKSPEGRRETMALLRQSGWSGA